MSMRLIPTLHVVIPFHYHGVVRHIRVCGVGMYQFVHLLLLMDTIISLDIL